MCLTVKPLTYTLLNLAYTYRELIELNNQKETLIYLTKMCTIYQKRHFAFS